MVCFNYIQFTLMNAIVMKIIGEFFLVRLSVYYASEKIETMNFA